MVSLLEHLRNLNAVTRIFYNQNRVLSPRDCKERKGICLLCQIRTECQKKQVLNEWVILATNLEVLSYSNYREMYFVILSSLNDSFQRGGHFASFPWDVFSGSEETPVFNSYKRVSCSLCVLPPFGIRFASQGIVGSYQNIRFAYVYPQGISTF